MIDQVAKLYHEHNLTVTPIHEQGHPFREWKKFYETPQSLANVQLDFNQNSYGVAVLCGLNDVESIDIDTKNAPDKNIYLDFVRVVNSYCKDYDLPPLHEWTGVYIEQTKSDGRHLIYRTRKEIRSKMLARAENGNPIIEVLGSGHTCTVAPTHGYVQLTFATNLEQIDYISDQQRQCLFLAAESFNQFFSNEAEDLPMPKGNPDRKSSWEDYNEQTTVDEMLSMLNMIGWEVHKGASKADEYRLIRPGSRSGGVDAGLKIDTKQFTVYSTSSDMYREKNGRWQCWYPFHIYSFVNHNEDYSAAAKALYQKGYGTQPATPRERESHTSAGFLGEQKENESESDDKKSRWRRWFVEHQWNPDSPPPYMEPVLTYTPHLGQPTTLARQGSIVTIGGWEKARKTYLSRCLQASAMSHVSPIGFKLHAHNADIYHFNTEEEDWYYHKGNEEVMRLAGINQMPITFKSVPLLSLSNPVDRMECIYYNCYDEDSIIFIDQVADLCIDTNDKREITKVVQFIMDLKLRGATIFLSIHLNPGSTKEQGALGTELRRKSSCVFNLTVDLANVTELRLKFLRGARKPFDTLYFTHDADGMPTELRGYVPVTGAMF